MEAMRHSTATSFGQCNCRWCGKRRGFDGCPVTQAMRLAVCRFAKDNGRLWKSKLIAAWAAGENLGPELQAVRNVMGPRMILKLSPKTLERALLQ